MANMWNKALAMWEYADSLEEYEWFIIGGDDLFVVVENLRQLIRSVVLNNAAGSSFVSTQYNHRFCDLFVFSCSVFR